MRKKQLISEVALLFVAFAWGATFLLVQNAVDTLPTFMYNGVRFLLAFLFLLVWLLLSKKKSLPHFNKQLILSGMLLGSILCAGYLLQTIGLRFTTSAKAGFITGLCFVLVPFLSFLLLKEKPRVNAIVGVILAAIGLYLLTSGVSTQMNKGDVFEFFCAIAFGFHIVLTGKYAMSYPALLLTIVQMATVCVISFSISFITYGLHHVLDLQDTSFLVTIDQMFYEDISILVNPDIMFSKEIMLSLFITSIFATALAFFIQTTCQQYSSPTRAALIMAMEPVFAALVAVLFAGETITWIALMGGSLIFIGMISAEIQWTKKSTLMM